MHPKQAKLNLALEEERVWTRSQAGRYAKLVLFAGENVQGLLPARPALVILYCVTTCRHGVNFLSVHSHLSLGLRGLQMVVVRRGDWVEDPGLRWL